MFLIFNKEHLLYSDIFTANANAASLSVFYCLAAIVQEYYDRFSSEEQNGFWGKNAETFYSL